MTSEEKKEQEFYSLRNIPDSFKKIVITNGAKKLLQNAGLGTKSQHALAFQQEELKTERKKISKAEKIAQKQHHFDAKQQKRKEKHKGH